MSYFYYNRVRFIAIYSALLLKVIYFKWKYLIFLIFRHSYLFFEDSSKGSWNNWKNVVCSIKKRYISWALTRSLTFYSVKSKYFPHKGVKLSSQHILSDAYNKRVNQLTLNFQLSCINLLYAIKIVNYRCFVLFISGLCATYLMQVCLTNI